MINNEDLKKQNIRLILGNKAISEKLMIITRKNLDLQKENVKAKKIIKKLLHALINENSEYTFALKSTHPVLKEADQFINETPQSIK